MSKQKMNVQPQTNLKGGEKAFDQVEPLQAKPLEVKVYNNFDRAVKAFRALVQKERVISNYKEKQRYEKPSDKKRRKRAERERKLFELQNKDVFSPKKSKKYKTDKHNEQIAESSNDD